MTQPTAGQHALISFALIGAMFGSGAIKPPRPPSSPVSGRKKQIAPPPP
jgi:hypothetical protein